VPDGRREREARRGPPAAWLTFCVEADRASTPVAAPVWREGQPKRLWDRLSTSKRSAATAAPAFEGAIGRMIWKWLVGAFPSLYDGQRPFFSIDNVAPFERVVPEQDRPVTSAFRVIGPTGLSENGWDGAGLRCRVSS